MSGNIVWIFPAPKVQKPFLTDELHNSWMGRPCSHDCGLWSWRCFLCWRGLLHVLLSFCFWEAWLIPHLQRHWALSSQWSVSYFKQIHRRIHEKADVVWGSSIVEYITLLSRGRLSLSECLALGWVKFRPTLSYSETLKKQFLKLLLAKTYVKHTQLFPWRPLVYICTHSLLREDGRL